MSSINFLQKTLNAVSVLALSSVFLASALTTTSWAMDQEQEERQNFQQQKLVVKDKKTIGFVQEIFDTRGKIKNFSDEKAQEFFGNLGCKVTLSYPGTDSYGVKRGQTVLSFETPEGKLKMNYHHGYSQYTISPYLKAHIKQFLIEINRIPENLTVQ